MVLSRLFYHLDLNNLLAVNQHGFLRGKSTSTALVDIIEFICDSLEKGENVTGIFLDLSKAFDSLSHELIMHKLNNLGIGGSALSWIGSYLRGRQQLVEVKQTINGQVLTGRSGLLPVLRGVPQGSVLGPVLFILFVNDFPSYIHPFSHSVVYADDTVLLTSNHSVETLEINSFISLNIAAEYCNNNSLIFNKSKTNQLNFGNKKEEIADLPELTSKASIKHLGVVLDEKLAWQDHVEYLCSKLSSAVFAIRRTSAISTTEAALTAYHALFESHLRYGIAVWGGSSQGNMNRALYFQKQALRAMTGAGWRDSCRGIFVELKLLTVVSIYILEVVSTVALKNLPRNESNHQYPTRYGRNYELPVHHLSQFEKKPSYAGMKFFNLLPEEMKRLEPRKLKTQLANWLRSRPFYTVREFLGWRHFSW